MVELIRNTDTEFEQSVQALLNNKLEQDPQLIATVRDIINDVQTRGDDALLEYTERFDKNAISASELKISQDRIDQAYDSIDQTLREHLELAATRIRSYHERIMPSDINYTDDIGVELGNVWRPIEKAGLYVPGGLASYPSSVLMNAIPAIVAGVSSIVMVVPAPNGVLNDVVLAAAKIAGIDTIYTIGGSQAIAALAYGTATIPKVDKIVGPGNAYVAASKRLVYGEVGIDMIAGPSEVLVITDGSSNPKWVAADLLSQAEHDTAARAILISDDLAFAEHVMQEVETIIPQLDRSDIARESWDNNGAVFVVDSLNEAAALSNRLAPEHLILAVDQPHPLLDEIAHAGAVFLGHYTPESIGDYTAGPSHVLPTAASARFSSGLSVFDFIKRMSVMECDKSSFGILAKATENLALAEGLDAHALAVSIRNNDS